MADSTFDWHPCVSVSIFDKDQLPHPPEKELSGKEMEEIVNADVVAFEKFFGEKLKNGGLSGPERSIIKTYIYWKTHDEEEILRRLGSS